MDKPSCSQSVQQRNEDEDDFNVYSSSTNGSPQLHTLPDDCLLKLFSVKYVDLEDLCSLAESCKRFRSITRRITGTEFKIILFNGMYEFVSKKFHVLNGKPYGGELGDGNDARRFFSNFGSCWSELFLNSENRQHKTHVFSLVRNHCVEKLKLLSIYQMKVGDYDSHNLFSGFHSLVELRVIQVRNCEKILENVFPKLERFTFANEITDDGNRDVKKNPYLETQPTFIANHPALKSIDISLYCEHNWWINILQAIGTSCTSLQSLTISNLIKTGEEHLSISLKALQALKSLKTLKLCKVTFEDFEEFASMKELCALELEFCILPSDVDQFARLVHLTEFVLKECELSDTYHVTDIIQRLETLERLVVDKENFKLNEKTFWKIGDIVKRRPQVLKLICRYDSTVKRSRDSKVDLYRLS